MIASIFRDTGRNRLSSASLSHQHSVTKVSRSPSAEPTRRVAPGKRQFDSLELHWLPSISADSLARYTGTLETHGLKC